MQIERKGKKEFKFEKKKKEQKKKIPLKTFICKYTSFKVPISKILYFSILSTESCKYFFLNKKM